MRAAITWAAVVMGLALLAGCGGSTSAGAQAIEDAGEAVDAPDVDLQASDTPEGGEEVGTPDGPDTAEPEPEAPPIPEVPDFLGDDAGDARSGRLRLLTYNVAGLPQGVSSSNPVRNIPLMSPLLNAYDLVLAQEDFWYPEVLRAEAAHPYITIPWRSLNPGADNIGDGLNRLSIFPFGALERVPWGACHGRFDCANDCLATKGFSFAATKLANGVEVDVYNLHAEAGGCDGDEVARQQGIEALIAFAQARSEGRAIIIGGDFNLHVERDPADGALYALLIDSLALRDACLELACGDDRIDRVLVRSAGGVVLTPVTWGVPPEFVTPEGEDLSDHKPVFVEIEWSAP